MFTQKTRVTMPLTGWAASAEWGNSLLRMLDRSGTPAMKHYRIEKVSRPGGAVLKKKDIIAASDSEAIDRAVRSPDCPVCDVLKDGKPIASIA